MNAAIFRRRRRTRGKLVLQHTFSGPDSTTTVGPADTGQPPIVLSTGVWGRIGGEAYMVTASASNKDAHVFETAVADKIRVSMKFSTLSIYERLYFRTVDLDNTMLLAANTTNVYVIALVAGAFTVLLNVARASLAGEQLGVRLDGSLITVFASTGDVASVTNTNFMTATRHGIGQEVNAPAGRRYDNLRVERI